MPNAQTGKATSDGPTRTDRDAGPPGSGSSKLSRTEVERPLPRRLPNRIATSVERSVRDTTETPTLLPFSVARKPVVPGRTARFARSNT